MNFLILAIVFIFGAAIGSFLNVVIYRYNSSVSPLQGRSQCFACGKTLAWYELVPIASFLIQRGRCRGCKVKLSWQYPLIEAATGAIFVAIAVLQKPLVESVYLAIIFSTLLVIAAYDLRHRIIPDGLAIFFAVIALSWFIWSTPADFARLLHFPYHWHLLAGPLLFLPFFLLWLVSHGRWIGLGDGKLALGIGWFLGMTEGGSAIMLAFWIGAAYALTIMAIQKISTIASTYVSQKSKVLKSKAIAPTLLLMFGFRLSDLRLSMKSEIPFGPFLILGVFIVYFTQMNLFDGSITFIIPLLS